MFCTTATTLVPIQQSTGVELTANLAFEQSPKRLHTRLKTLQKYILKYPTGWKKRLELADVLYALGHWSQAAEEYQRVLDRQPHLLNVWLQLGQILRLLDQSQDATAVYQSALEQVSDAATRHHIQGLIYDCNEHHIAARMAYQQAVDTEADNDAHWFALAQAHLREDDFEAAIAVYDHILEQQPDNAIALSHKADLFWAMTCLRRLHSIGRKSSAIAPHHAPGIKRLLDHRCRNGLVQGDEKP
ncbi:MAG: tetratricopeptide repeat protein [Acaryochloridaceae cyanobacterium RL_2_7]|nr:tetratricopeptide repeat protein [Acaryochloridaceae cyanobacterium RL_2_7]